MGTLTWLHVSDIHFRPQTEWKDATARKALLDHLKAQRARHKLDIDLVFCTGDIAFGELPKQSLQQQYAMAEQFFEELLAICGSKGRPLARDRLFVVPGNHDVDRDAVDPAAQESWTRWGSPAEARQLCGKVAQDFAALKSSPALAMQRLKAYGEFATRFLPHQRPATGHHHYAQRLTINGVEIGISGFNSAWTCYGEDDDRTLWLGAEPQFDAMRASLEGVALRVGLIHHPHDWFNEAERSLVRDRAEYDFDFWLHGHTHDLRVHDDAELATVGAGALTGEQSEEFGYNVVRFDTRARAGSAYLYHWDGRRGDWKPLTIPKIAEYGVQPIRLPDGTVTQPILGTADESDDAPLLLRRDAALPPPAACLERASELAKLAAWSVQVPPVPVLICGYGGLGKTEVAVRYLHSEEARQQFGAQRYFVSVEGLESTPPADLPNRFWSILALALFGRTAQSLSAARLIEDLRQVLASQARPALLVLDNFETVVLTDPHFAVATLGQLAGLAAQGLTLHVTLREPLPDLGVRHERLPLQPLKDPSAARRMFCHWMHSDPDAILSTDDTAALDHLLELAEGWPIQLQMLGVVAEVEGLRSLAARCPTATQMAALVAGQDQPDRHRHPHLSCRITYESPGLGKSARQLLRCLAYFPDGVPADWLADWPEQGAVRELQRYKTLLEAQGKADEPRRKLPAPLRDFLHHAYSLDDEDKIALGSAWVAWWLRTAPELFDTELPRHAPAVYRDFFEQEFGSVIGLRLAGVLSIRHSRSLEKALRNLAEWVGDLSDWVAWIAELRRIIEHAKELFGSAKRAERFARLLAGSQCLPVPTKQQILDLVKRHALTPYPIEALEKTFLQELDAWAWRFGSHDLAERLSNHLAEGRICLEGGASELLVAISEIDVEDERIALLDVALDRHWTDEDRARLKIARAAALSTSATALSCSLQAESCSKPDALKFFDQAVELQPDYGSAWNALAGLTSRSKAEVALRQVRRCAEAHLSETHGRNWVPSIFRSAALSSLHGACRALGEEDKAMAALKERVETLDRSDSTKDQIDVAVDCLDSGLVDQAAKICLRMAAKPLLDEEGKRLIEKFSWTLFSHAPHHALSLIKTLFGRDRDARSLVAAASMLFHAGVPKLGYEFCRAAAAVDLDAAQANDLAYNLATRGDDSPAMLAFALELAERSVALEADTARAETLLCTCLRHPEGTDSASSTYALSLLLAVNADSSEDDLCQLAAVLLDADRYDGRQRLANWLAAAPTPIREGTAGRALHAWIRNTAADDEAADALLADLDRLRRTIADRIAAEAQVTERIKEHRDEIAGVAQAWLDTMGAARKIPSLDR